MPQSEINPLMCPRCGQRNSCGFAQGQAQCWCMQLPARSTVPVNTAANPAVCYCQACLTELTAAGKCEQSSKAEQYKAEGST